MNHLMIDFETLDTKPTSVVLSLGLVLFNKEQILETAYFEFDIQSQLDTGRTVSGSTILWWLNQTSGRSFNPPTEHFAETLMKINKWLFECHVYGGFDSVWANDPSFDCSILENLMERTGHPVPYKFWQTRSMRTFIQYVGNGERVPRDPATHHNALADAEAQAKYVMARLP